MLRLRRELRLGEGSLTWEDSLGEDIVAFRVTTGVARVLVVANLGPRPVELPERGHVVLGTGELDDGRVPTDVTVWLREV